MKNEEKILWQLSSRGDEFLQKIALLLLRNNNKGFTMEYGEQKEKDKGRDIIIYSNDMFFSEIVQVKHKRMNNENFTKVMFLKELSKTLIHIILDERDLMQLHINHEADFTFSILLNFKNDKTIMDVNSDIKGDVENVAKLLFKNRDVKRNKRFKGLKYMDVKDDLIKLLSISKILVYNSSYLYENIIECPAALFQFDNISFEISRLINEDEISEIEAICKGGGMHFLTELEKIDYDKFTETYTYAIEDYAKAFSVFNCLNLTARIINDNNWERDYKKKIRRRYNERKEQFSRKLEGRDLIEVCKEFYCDVVVNLEVPTKVHKVTSDIEVEKGLYHLEVEEGNLKGWRLDE